MSYQKFNQYLKTDNSDNKGTKFCAPTPAKKAPHTSNQPTQGQTQEPASTDKKPLKPYQKRGLPNPKRKGGYRVKSMIKNFRDLQVYTTTTSLAAEIFALELPAGKKRNKALQTEFTTLKTLAKYPPKLIAESYGNKFTSIELANQKLETTLQIIVDIIAKSDFLAVYFKEDEELANTLRGYSTRYSKVRLKILNLKKAWNRIF